MFHTINHQIHCIVYLPNLTKRSPGESSVFICSNSIRGEERRSSSQHHNIVYNRKYPVNYQWDIFDPAWGRSGPFKLWRHQYLCWPLFWLVSSGSVGRWYKVGSWIIKVSFIWQPGGRAEEEREPQHMETERMRWEENQLCLGLFQFAWLLSAMPRTACWETIITCIRYITGMSFTSQSR